MAYTNSQIVPLAIAGKDASSANGNFSTRSTPSGINRGGYSTGHLPPRLARIMRERADSIVQVIYSYNTPIAWLDAGLWVIPDVKYSATTSTKHAPNLYKLSAIRYIPWDCGMEEYMRIQNGLMYYARENGRYFPTGTDN